MRTQSNQHQSLPESAGAYLPFVYLPIKAVLGAVGLSTSRVYELIRQGEFPPGDLIGAQSRRWKSTDISAWLIAQSEKSARREVDLGAPLKRKADAASKCSAAKRVSAKEVSNAQRAVEVGLQGLPRDKEADHAPV
jgi:prophage regulatory protein